MLVVHVRYGLSMTWFGLNVLVESCGDCLSRFQSFTSCIIILYGIAQKQLQDYSEMDCQDDLIQAEKCLQVLSWCGQADPVARRFHDMLQPYYDTLRGSRLAEEVNEEELEVGMIDRSRNPASHSASMDAGISSGMSQGSNTTSDAQLIFTVPPGNSVSRDLLNLVRCPFGNHDREKMDESTVMACSADCMDLDDTSLPNEQRDWRFEVTSPLNWQDPDLNRCYDNDLREHRDGPTPELSFYLSEGHYVGSNTPSVGDPVPR